MNSLIIIIGVVIIGTFTTRSYGDLVVNIRNQGGESYKQTIRANLSDETVALSFYSHDGSSTVMIIDFRNEIQLVHVIRLGDQEEHELVFPSAAAVNSVHDEEMNSGKKFIRSNGVGGNRKLHLGGGVNSYNVYRSYCFVTKFKPNEFIPVDAMAKLRQKNPWSLRSPERNEPPQNISFDILLDATASDWISPMIKEHCVGDSSFRTTTYAIKMEISEKAVNPEDYLRSVRDIVLEDDKMCGDAKDHLKPCVCSDAVCIGWYPCALKFCRTRSSGNGAGTSNATGTLGGGGVVMPVVGGAAAGMGGSSTGTPDANYKTYRCGIHTCRVCRNYFFGVRGVAECI